MSDKRVFCAEYSREAGEELAGTVKPADQWLLIEQRAVWPRNAIDAFSERVQERLGDLMLKTPKLHLCLMKQPDRTRGPLTLFHALSRETAPLLHRIEFESYEDLVFNTEPPPNQSSEPLFGVCTHGTHDLCCAKFGNEIYSELRKLTDNVWQVSHLGGCRFAPNLVCLPRGAVYGRVERGDCSAIVSGQESVSILTAKLRGRSYYVQPVQAAEALLRKRATLSGEVDLRLTRFEQLESERWSVTFGTAEFQQYQVSVVYEETDVKTYKSCSSAQATPRGRFRLVDE